MKRALLLMMCLGAYPAFAAPIPDLSLPPEESLRQPDITRSPGGLTSHPRQGFGREPSPPIRRMDQPIPTAKKYFMDSYCDPGFTPAARTTNSLQTCFTTMRHDACERFQTLPADAKEVLDNAIGCEAANAELEAPSAGCANTDRLRLQLLKKYWREIDVAYALAFLPDMVNNPTAECMREGN